jgi:hypothetical protein
MSPKFGFTHSKESRTKMSLSHTGVKIPEDVVRKSADKHIGLKRSEATKLKMSLASKGKPKSEAHKQRLREVRTGIPIHTPESKQRIVAALKVRIRKPLTADTLERMRVVHSGINNARFGTSHTYESRMKIIEGNIGGFWYGNVRHYDRQQYCEKFNENFKERVRAFFEYQCVKCHAAQNGKKLDVHHVNYNKAACCDDTPKLFVPLCTSCHGTVGSRGNPYWIEYFTTMIDEDYGGKCYFTKDEMKERLCGEVF